MCSAIDVFTPFWISSVADFCHTCLKLQNTSKATIMTTNHVLVEIDIALLSKANNTFNLFSLEFQSPYATLDFRCI